MILCLFNKFEVLTYTDIKEKSSIPENELNNALLFLCNPKQAILKKENDKKPQFLPTEKLTCN